MIRRTATALVLTSTIAAGAAAQTPPPAPAATPDSPRLAAQKQEAVKGVDELAKLAQEMVDSVFSFGELGMQEVETSKYLTGQLEKFQWFVRAHLESYTGELKHSGASGEKEAADAAR